jgi:hypothetical protein
MNMKCPATFLIAIALLAGCKKHAEADAARVARSAVVTANTPAASTALPTTDPTVRSAASRPSELPAPEANPAATAAFSRYRDPPRADVGLSVEQAYAAIPHRRTAWIESETTVPAGERAYLKTIFAVVDEAVAVRVVGLQNFSQQHFDAIDVDRQFDRLISFALSMPVPARLDAHHRQILSALAADRRFFADWKAHGAAFPFAQQIAANGNVQAASAAARAAYGELMSKYPGESQSNKDAFFDYHCALDFL